jgi:hypothetical protein
VFEARGVVLMMMEIGMKNMMMSSVTPVMPRMMILMMKLKI